MSQADKNSDPLSVVEIDKTALTKNLQSLKKCLKNGALIAPCVKANAYGHGLTLTGKILEKAGADWLCVNALFEALALRKAGIRIPIYILGYTPLSQLSEIVKNGFRQVSYNKESLKRLGTISEELKKPALIHLKIETGTNRQGVMETDLEEILTLIKEYPRIELEGISMHFANIEDTESPQYAFLQLKKFHRLIKKAEEILGKKIPLRHCANSASTILYPETHLDLVRPGISTYGLWPSLANIRVAKKKGIHINLKPVLTWKTQIAQIKVIPKSHSIGYGCSFKTRRNTKMAIIPVGYYDGYDRSASNRAYVLIKGKKGRLLGRVCMNMIMVDITDIKDVKTEDEVVLLGRQGKNEISAEDFAKWCSTINYEVTTRILERIPRIMV